MLPADLALYDRYGQLVGLVKVKSRPGTSSEWAAQFRRNLGSHDDFPPVRYFLIVTQDRLFLWKEAERRPDAPPDYSIDLRTFLRPYVDRIDSEEGPLSGPAFELVVGSWLADLMYSTERSPGDAQARQLLAESGLIDALRDGRVEYDLAA